MTDVSVAPPRASVRLVSFDVTDPEMVGAVTFAAETADVKLGDGNSNRLFVALISGSVWCYKLVEVIAVISLKGLTRHDKRKHFFPRDLFRW